MKKRDKKFFTAGILGNKSGQDNMEYVVAGLVAALIIMVIWQVWAHNLVVSIFENWNAIR